MLTEILKVVEKHELVQEVLSFYAPLEVTKTGVCCVGLPSLQRHSTDSRCNKIAIISYILTILLNY